MGSKSRVNGLLDAPHLQMQGDGVAVCKRRYQGQFGVPSPVAALAFAVLSACSPAGTGEDPRDRKGADGALTWRSVADADGQAAFLSRPGAAPDLVLWCRANGLLTLRAHVFEDPAPQPDLIIMTDGGTIAFDNVRRQGGVRAGDRKLVEGAVTLLDAKLPAVLLGADNLSVSSGGVKFEAKNTDPNNILPAFSAACTSTRSIAKGKS